MKTENTLGYAYEERAKNHIRDTSYGTSANAPVLALAYAVLASMEVGRQIASTLEDIHSALRDLVKILEKNQHEGGTEPV